MKTDAPAECAYCGEPFSSTASYDRHLLIRRMTVTSPKGHVVENEEVVTCRPVEEFSKPLRNGKPRLVRNAKGWWVTELKPAGLVRRLRDPGEGVADG